MEERIKYLRKYLKLSQEAFGSKLGVSRDVINNIERGRNKNPISNLFIQHLCDVFYVNPDWLHTGEGEMFLPNDNSPLDELQKQYNLSDNVVNILHNFFQLTKEEQDSFIAQAEKIFHADN